jgi:hypothetical protein
MISRSLRIFEDVIVLGLLAGSAALLQTLGWRADRRRAREDFRD